MSISLKVALISPLQRSEIFFTLAHLRSSPLRVIFATEHQAIFYNDALINTHYKNIVFQTFESFLAEEITSKEIVVIADVPDKFQILEEIVKKIDGQGNEAILVVLKYNKKYLNFVEKKISIKTEIMQFSPNKFVGINDKLREFVQKSYDLNRAGFYAYGSYLNYFRSNMVKKIFRTDQINVNQLANSFGFTTPPRVKDGKFLTDKARKQRKIQKINDKKVLKQKQEKEKVEVEAKSGVQEPKTAQKSKKGAENTDKKSKASRVPQKTKQIAKKIPRVK